MKDYNVNLKMDSKGQLIHRTEEINGILKFIMVKSDFIDAKIRIVTANKLMVLETSLKGNQVFFPKIKNVDNRGQELMIEAGHYSEIPLNDVLEIQIESGIPEKEVELNIRYI